MGPAFDDEDLQDEMLGIEEDNAFDEFHITESKRHREKRKVVHQMDEVGGAEELGYKEEEGGEEEVVAVEGEQERGERSRRRPTGKSHKRNKRGLGGAINIDFAKFKEALVDREELGVNLARGRARRPRVVKSTFGKASRFGAPSKTRHQEDEERARRLEPKPPANDGRKAGQMQQQGRQRRRRRAGGGGRFNTKAGPLARMNAVLKSESSWLEQQQRKRRALSEKRDGMQLLRLEHRLVELEMERLNDRIDHRIHKVEHDLQDLSIAVEQKAVDLNYIAAGAGQRAAARSFIDASESKAGGARGKRKANGGRRGRKGRRLRLRDPKDERYRSMAGLAHVGRGISGFGPGLGYAAAMGHAASVAAHSGHVLQSIPPPQWLPSVSRAEAEAAASSARMLAATGRLGVSVEDATEELDARLAPYSRPTSEDLSDAGLGVGAGVGAGAGVWAGAGVGLGLRGDDLGLAGTSDFVVEWNRKD